MKKSGLNILMCVMLCFVVVPSQAITRKALVQYAQSLKGKKKAELKTAIYELCQPKTTLSYGSGSGKTWSGFYKTDRISTTNECVNRYSTKKFYFTSTTDAISGMNIEHSFPKSWWGGSDNKAYKDLFNLYPSESEANSKKSNYPMGKVTNANLLNDFEKVGTGPIGDKVYISLCEPNDLWKGDFCRSYFYMATIYQNLTWQGTQGLQQLENNKWPTLQKWAYTLYLEWTRADKVMDIEVQRNNAIYSIQGNRNLFIDFPYLAEYVWGDSINVEFDPNTSITTADGDTRYTTTPTPGTGEGGEGGDPDPGEDPDPEIGGEYDGNIDWAADYLFKETFDKYTATGGNDGKWNGSIASGTISNDNNDENGWTFNKDAAANKCIKIGTSNDAGSATTRMISGLKGTSFTLLFTAAAWSVDNESTTLNISSSGCTLSQKTVTLKKGEWTTYAIEVGDVTGDVQFSFYGTSGKNRFFLDSVLIPTNMIIIPGDLNNDHSVTLADLSLLINMINTKDAAYSKAADMNNDGAVDLKDVTILVEKLLGK